MTCCPFWLEKCEKLVDTLLGKVCKTKGSK